MNPYCSYQQSNPVTSLLILFVLGVVLGAVFVIIAAAKKHSLVKGSGKILVFGSTLEKAFEAIPRALAEVGYDLTSQDKEKGQLLFSSQKLTGIYPKVTIFVDSAEEKDKINVELIVKLSEFAWLDKNAGYKSRLSAKIENSLIRALGDAASVTSEAITPEKPAPQQAPSSSQKTCSQCNTANPQDAKFCGNCGNTLS